MMEKSIPILIEKHNSEDDRKIFVTTELKICNL